MVIFSWNIPNISLNLCHIYSYNIGPVKSFCLYGNDNALIIGGIARLTGCSILNGKASYIDNNLITGNALIQESFLYLSVRQLELKKSLYINIIGPILAIAVTRDNTYIVCLLARNTVAIYKNEADRPAYILEEAKSGIGRRPLLVRDITILDEFCDMLLVNKYIVLRGLMGSIKMLRFPEAWCYYGFIFKFIIYINRAYIRAPIWTHKYGPNKYSSILIFSNLL